MQSITPHGMLVGPLPGEPLSEDTMRGVGPITSLTMSRPLLGLVCSIEGPKAPFWIKLIIDLVALIGVIYRDVFIVPRSMCWVPF